MQNIKKDVCRYASHERPRMRMNTDVCKFCLYAQCACVCIPSPNCKTGLGFIFVMWEKGSLQLKWTSAKNKLAHLALIKTAWLYSCCCSDPRASGKNRERKKNTHTQMCARYTDMYTHLNKRSNTCINKSRKCVLWEEAADLTVATALMNNCPDNQ